MIFPNQTSRTHCHGVAVSGLSVPDITVRRLKETDVLADTTVKLERGVSG